MLGRRRHSGWRRETRGQTEGFSLVEMASSLGIISFGLVTLLSLLPLGLRLSAQARETTAEAQIAQYLSNLARQTDSAQLQTILEPTVHHFDRDGLAVREDSSEACFRATLARTGATTAESSADSISGARLATLHIRLATNQKPGEERLFPVHLPLGEP